MITMQLAIHVECIIGRRLNNNRDERATVSISRRPKSFERRIDGFCSRRVVYRSGKFEPNTEGKKGNRDISVYNRSLVSLFSTRRVENYFHVARPPLIQT